MNQEFLVKRARAAGAFSLIEVVIAIGIFGSSILAIIGLLGSISRSTAEVMDAGVAARIADAVRAELRQLAVVEGLDEIARRTTIDNPLELFATKHGDRVLSENNVGNPQSSNPPEIAARDRFFRIEVTQLEDSLAYDDDAAFIALSVRVYWPHYIPTGPGEEDYREVDSHRQNVSIFNTAILRRSRFFYGANEQS